MNTITSNGRLCRQFYFVDGGEISKALKPYGFNCNEAYEIEDLKGLQFSHDGKSWHCFTSNVSSLKFFKGNHCYLQHWDSKSQCLVNKWDERFRGKSTKVLVRKAVEEQKAPQVAFKAVEVPQQPLEVVVEPAQQELSTQDLVKLLLTRLG